LYWSWRRPPASPRGKRRSRHPISRAPRKRSSRAACARSYRWFPWVARTSGMAGRAPSRDRCLRRTASTCNARRTLRMIVETILTTMDAQGVLNFAPMGVEWGEDEIVIKPFVDTTTFRNLDATGQAVVNLTDDVLCF